MRILITGINGFAGRHLTRHLLSAGHSVAGLYFGDLGGLDSAQIDLHECDITDFDSLNQIVNNLDFDAVIHLAGFASAGQSFRHVRTTHAINYTGTLHLLEALSRYERQKIVKILHISTAEVYAPSSEALSEEASLHPGSPYAASKLASEVLAKYYGQERGLPIVIARPFNHIGPGQSLDFFLPSVIKQFSDAQKEGKKSFSLSVGNIEVIRDFHAVEDACAAYALLIEKGVPGEIYNTGSGTGYALKEIIEEAAQIAGLDITIEIDEAKYRPADKPILLANAQKMKNLGWQPRLSIREVLTRMLQEN